MAIQKSSRMLFGNFWKNTRGETDGWQFYIKGDKIIFELDLLFDTDPWQDDYGHAEFDKNEFKCFLEEYFRNGYSRLFQKNYYWSNGYDEVIFKKRTDGKTLVSIGLINHGTG